MKKLLSQAFFITALSVLLGLGVNFGLIKQYLNGDFNYAFLSAEEYPSLSFITLAEAENLFSIQEALFIDSRNADSYREGRIFGAINIPYETEGDTRLLAEMSVPKEMTLVVYCDGSECQSSVGLAKRLNEEGFTDIRVFFGGWEEWLREGLPVKKGNDK